MTLLSRHMILNNSPGGLRPSTLPLVYWGSPQYLRLMTPRSLGSKFHHLRASCNLLTNVLSCFWSVTLMERQSSTKAFGDERDWVLALSTWERNHVALWQTLAFYSQRNDSMVLIPSTDLSPRLFQPHCDVQDNFLFPPCWCCVHDWNCREVDAAGTCWLV